MWMQQHLRKGCGLHLDGTKSILLQKCYTVDFVYRYHGVTQSAFGQNVFQESPVILVVHTVKTFQWSFISF